MKCAYHNDVDAVASCNICGKSLCSTCASVIQPPQCVGCYRDGLIQRKSNVRGSLITDILLGVASAVFFPYLFSTTGSLYSSVLEIALLSAGVPFGWRFLNKITPDIFLSLPMVGWFIYFGCKWFLSVCVGVFVAPYVIWKKIKEMKQVQQLIDDVANMDNRSLVADK